MIAPIFLFPAASSTSSNNARRQEAEVAERREQLQRIEQSIQSHERSKDKIIEHRIQQMLDPQRRRDSDLDLRLRWSSDVREKPGEIQEEVERRQESLREELESLRKRLDTIEKKIARREARVNEIVERRVEELLSGGQSAAPEDTGRGDPMDKASLELAGVWRLSGETSNGKERNTGMTGLGRIVPPIHWMLAASARERPTNRLKQALATSRIVGVNPQARLLLAAPESRQSS